MLSARTRRTAPEHPGDEAKSCENTGESSKRHGCIHSFENPPWALTLISGRGLGSTGTHPLPNFEQHDQDCDQSGADQQRGLLA